jgi:histone H3/H4
MKAENQRVRLFPKVTIRTILKNNGVKNILDETIDLMNEVISKISLEIADGAIKLTKLKGIKTIYNDAIKISTQEFLGKRLNNIEVRLFANSQIRKIMEKSGAKRISKDAINCFNEIVSKIIEDIALDVAKIIFKNENQINQNEAVKLSTQNFLKVNNGNKNKEDN